MATSILNRKRDLLYLIFFSIHLPVMFLVDLAPLWPALVKPVFLESIRTYYTTTFRDQFFISPPAWFNAYMYMELIYHVPLSLWAIGALLRDDPMIPVHLLIFSMQTGMTTLTCVADFMSWSDYLMHEKIALAQLYVPYLALAALMGLDMYSRLAKRIKQHFTVANSKKSL